MAADPTSATPAHWLIQLIGNPKVSATVSIATATLLLSPEKVRHRFRVDQLVSQYGSWIGLICYVATAAFLVEIVTSEHIRNWWRHRERLKRLCKLTPDEKAILRRYIDGQTHTKDFEVTNGVVMGLVAEGILFRPGALGYAESFPFNIYQWAWDYLDKNRHLLALDDRGPSEIGRENEPPS